MKKIQRHDALSVQDGADQGPGDGGDAPDAREQRLRPGTFLQREHVADDDHPNRQHAAGTDALEGPEHDELRHRRRHATQHRTEHEQAERDQVWPTTAVHVGQPAHTGVVTVDVSM